MKTQEKQKKVLVLLSQQASAVSRLGAQAGFNLF